MNSPQVPDATATANAQTQSNISTAKAQQNLNQVNQVTPTGTLTYSQDGTNPDGTPKTTATTALNAPTQQLLTSGQTGAQNLLNQITSNTTNPQTLSQQTQTQLDDLASQRLDPALAKQRASLEQRLANQHIAPGSEAYNNAITLDSQGANDARNNLILSGYSTANNAAMNQSNLPYNQLASLLTGNQTNSVNPTNTPQAGVQGTDTSGLINQQYQNQLSQTNATNNAIGSAAGTIGGWLFSDEKTKTDIHATGGKTQDGIPLKTFRYKGSPMMNLGVTAQDAEKKRPDAVKSVNGTKAVNYSAIGSPMLQLGKKAA